MALWDDISNRFKGKRSLDKVGMDDLSRERINLDQKEKDTLNPATVICNQDTRVLALFTKVK